MSKLPSLKAMAEGKVEGVSKVTMFTVDPDLVKFEPGFNLREEGPDLDAHLEALYVSMKAGANVPPIDVSVVDGEVIARDGHCRTRVARRLKAEGVPYLLQARQFRGNDAECVFHMISSSHGKSLTPLEAGRGFLRLVKYNLTVAEIVRRTGLNRTTIDNGITLAESPSAMQVMIGTGQVSCQVALDMIKKHGPKACEALRSAVEKVQSTGVKKVTKKHVSGTAVPKATVASFVSGSAALSAHVSEEFNERVLAETPDADLIGIPAGIVKQLLSAYSSIQAKDEL